MASWRLDDADELAAQYRYRLYKPSRETFTKLDDPDPAVAPRSGGALLLRRSPPHANQACTSPEGPSAGMARSHARRASAVSPCGCNKVSRSPSDTA